MSDLDRPELIPYPIDPKAVEVKKKLRAAFAKRSKGLANTELLLVRRIDKLFNMYTPSRDSQICDESKNTFLSSLRRLLDKGWVTRSAKRRIEGSSRPVCTYALTAEGARLLSLVEDEE